MPTQETVTFERLVALNRGWETCSTKRGRSAGNADTFRTGDVLPIWYGNPPGTGIKSEVENLVGWFHKERHPVLSSQQAYSIAYDAIFNALRHKEKQVV